MTGHNYSRRRLFRRFRSPQTTSSKTQPALNHRQELDFHRPSDAKEHSSNIISCHRFEIDAFAYFKELPTDLPQTAYQDDLAAFTSHHWKPTGWHISVTQ
jgi:hypothetical protein